MTTRARLGRLLRRLRRMSLAEAAFRARAEAYVLRERWQARRGRGPAARLRQPDLVPPLAGGGRFFFDPAQRPLMADWVRLHRPQWLARARAAAERRLASPVPDWHRDPSRAVAWPMSFYADLDIFSGDRGHGDVRVLWERNRHVELVQLAKAAFLTGERRYAARAVREWEDWVAANPYGRGVNWTSALEVAMRAWSWLWAVALLEATEPLSSSERLGLRAALHEHGVYLERHLSVYFSPNNHLVGEALGLFALGLLLPDLPKAGRWRRRGWAILEREAVRQYHPDGGSVEQATWYHYFTLGLLLQGVLLAERNGIAVAPETRRSLERALEFGMHLTRPDGRTPMIGDHDGGLACPAAEPPGWDFRPYLALGAAWLGRHDLRFVAGEYSELAFWLLGAEGRARFEALEPRPPQGLCAVFPDSGYVVARSGWDGRADYTCFDCGPLGQGEFEAGLPRSAHGHADALAVEISVSGRPVLVDPGIHSYNVEPDLLRYFRTTESHNTVTVDGRPQSEFAGRLRWGRAARARLDRFAAGEGCVYAEGSHDGYAQGPRPVRHRRGVLYEPGFGWIVRDRLDGEGEHEIAVHFSFAEGVTVEPAARGLVARAGDAALRIHLVAPAPAEPTLAFGELAPPRGWLGSVYGERRPAFAARWAARLRLPATLWQVYLPELGTAPEVRAVGGEAPDGIEIEHGAWRGLLVEGAGGRIRRGPWDLETDAEMVWLAARGEDDLRGLVLGGGLVRLAGRPIWSCEPPPEGARIRARLSPARTPGQGLS